MFGEASQTQCCLFDGDGDIAPHLKVSRTSLIPVKAPHLLHFDLCPASTFHGNSAARTGLNTPFISNVSHSIRVNGSWGKRTSVCWDDQKRLPNRGQVTSLDIRSYIFKRCRGAFNLVMSVKCFQSARIRPIVSERAQPDGTSYDRTVSMYRMLKSTQYTVCFYFLIPVMVSSFCYWNSSNLINQ